MDQLGFHPEPKRRPAVLLVVAAAPGLVRRRRLSQRGAHERLQQLDEGAGALESGRLIRHPHFERAEAGVRAHVPPEPRVVHRDADPHEPLDPLLPVLVRAKGRRRAAPRQLGEDRRPSREELRLDAAEIRGVDGQGQHERQPLENPLERVEAGLRGVDAHMDVEPAHALAAGDRAHVGDHVEVPLFLDDRQLLRRRDRMRARRGDPQAVPPPDRVSGRAELRERGDRLRGVGADPGVQLDDGRVELRLQPPRQVEPFRLAQEQVDGADRREALAVEDHDLLLDADGERRALAPGALDQRRTPWTGRPAASHA